MDNWGPASLGFKVESSCYPLSSGFVSDSVEFLGIVVEGYGSSEGLALWPRSHLPRVDNRSLDV